MTTTTMDSDKLKNLKSRLEGANDVNKENHVQIIEETSKELLDLFKQPDLVVNFSEKNDLEKVKKILEGRKKLLAERKSISETELTANYKELNSWTGAPLKTWEKDIIEQKMEILYEWKLIKQFNTLRNFKDFRDWIRKDPVIWINKIELTGKVDKESIKDIHRILLMAPMFKAGTSPEIKEKLTRLIILFAQVDMFVEAGKTKTQLEKANDILDKISLIFNQLEAYKSTNEALKKVKARESALAGLDTSNPNTLPDETPEKIIPKSIKYPLKNYFLDPTKWLEEDTEWYALTWLKFKSKTGAFIAIFEDAAGTVPFKKQLKKGEKADIFIKDWTSGKKLASIEITDIPNPELVITMEAYKDIPVDLTFPAGFEATVIWVGGKGKGIKDKVGITKNLDGKLDKPDFTPEYDSLDKKYKIKNKLDQIFEEAYELQLKDRLYEFMENDSHTKGERTRMNSDEKNHFFQDVIKTSAKPSRLSAGINKMIADIVQSKCYSNKAFANDFQKRILEIFTWKSETDLKKLIFEKLGNLDFTELNPTYAIKLLADKIKEKYTDHKDGIYEALNAYLLSVRNWWMKVTPEKLRNGEFAAVKEIKAVVADSKEINREDAYKNALKKLEDEYKSWAKFGFTRAKIFFFREKMLKDLINKELKGKGGLNMDEKTSSAANRWAAEKLMWGSFSENIVDVEKDTTEKIFDEPIFQQELDATVWKYINTNGDDATFQSEVEALINGNEELRRYMKRNNITHLGTNIIEQAKAEKAERDHYGSIITIIDRYTKDGVLNKPQEFDVEVRNALQKFMKEQKKLPEMVKSLWLDIDKLDFATKLATHRTTLETMRLRTVKMRLSLLVNKSEDEKWLTTAQYVNQDKFDPTHATKFTKRMGKHPRWTTGITALWLVGTGVVGALTMPVIGAAGGASILWYLNFLKKKGHYTQEHKKFEETIIAMTPDQRKKYLEDLKDNSEKRPSRIRWAFPTKYSKYGKSMEYFDNLDSVDNATKKIQNYMEKSGPFSPIEKKAFQRNLVDAITLLHAHKEKGRNFMFGKEGNTKIEELYNELYKIVMAGVTRYNPLAKNPESVVAKILSSIDTSAHVSENMNEYDRDYKKMRQMRNKLWIFAGTKSAGIYLASAYTLWWIKNHVVDAWNNIFPADASSVPTSTPNLLPAHNVITPAGTPGTSSLILDPAFGPNGDILKAQLFNGDVTKFNAFVAKVQTIPTGSHSEKLWSIFRDMYGTDQLANIKTHEFFNIFSSKITDMPLSAQQELVRLWTNFNLHSGDQISNLMTNRGYHGMVTNQADITNLIAGFKSWAIDLNNLPTGWTKETACNVLFCNAQGDQLTDLIFDTVKSAWTIPMPIPTPLPWITPAPMPTTPNVSGPRYKNFLSFWAPTVWNEVQEFNTNEPKPTPTVTA